MSSFVLIHILITRSDGVHMGHYSSLALTVSPKEQKRQDVCGGSNELGLRGVANHNRHDQLGLVP